METSVEILRRMNDYNRKVNANLLVHLDQAGQVNSRITTLMSHIINAHQIWLDRIDGKVPAMDVFATHAIPELTVLQEKNYQESIRVFESRDLDETITYLNTRQQKFINNILDIFLHIFNHSSYHRGQINQLLVQEGKKAMLSDYIAYNRTEITE